MDSLEVVQRQLDRLGWKNPASGQLDEWTAWGLRRFQEAAGLPRTGRPDATTVTALRAVVGQRAQEIYGPGMAGSRVADIQLRLMKLGFLPYPPPVGYEARTRDAVRAFQTYYGVRATGLVDEETLKRLYQVAPLTVGR